MSFVNASRYRVIVNEHISQLLLRIKMPTDVGVSCGMPGANTVNPFNEINQSGKCFPKLHRGISELH